MNDEELSVLLTLDADQYLRTSNRVNLANRGMATSIGTVQKSVHGPKQALRSFEAGLNGLRGAMVGVTGVATGFIGAFSALGGTLIGASLSAVGKAAEFESLSLQLEAVEGSAKKAELSLKSLREIAKAPGLNLEESVSTYSMLRNGGLDSALSMKLTKETGNAVARAGGGPAELSRVALQMMQMASTPKISGEELREIAQVGIPIYDMLLKRYGTSSGDELNKKGITPKKLLQDLSEDMSDLGRVSGGLANDLENLRSSIKMAEVGFGQGIAGVLVPKIQAFGDEVGKLEESGVFKSLGDIVGNNLFGTLPETAKGMEEALIGLGEVFVSVSAGLRNLGENIKGYADWWMNFTPMGWVAKMAGAGSGHMSPWEEGQAWGDQARQLITIRNKQAANAAKRAENATKPLEDESKKDEPPSPIVTKQVELLTRIESNTSELKGIREMILGGGAQSSAAFNAVNIGAWGGGGSSKIAGAIQMLIQGISEEQAASITQLARQRHLNPGSV